MDKGVLRLEHVPRRIEAGARLEDLPLPIVGTILVGTVTLVIGSSVGNVLPLPFSVPILVTGVGGELFSILWDVWHQHFSI